LAQSVDLLVVEATEESAIKVRDGVKDIFKNDPDLLEEFDALFAHMTTQPAKEGSAEETKAESK
jgi:histone deacetylase complex regulatory component SIN3